jgi:hypothetical protein
VRARSRSSGERRASAVAAGSGTLARMAEPARFSAPEPQTAARAEAPGEAAARERGPVPPCVRSAVPAAEPAAVRAPSRASGARRASAVAAGSGGPARMAGPAWVLGPLPVPEPRAAIPATAERTRLLGAGGLAPEARRIGPGELPACALKPRAAAELSPVPDSVGSAARREPSLPVLTGVAAVLVDGRGERCRYPPWRHPHGADGANPCLQEPARLVGARPGLIRRAVPDRVASACRPDGNPAAAPPPAGHGPEPRWEQPGRSQGQEPAHQVRTRSRPTKGPLAEMRRSPAEAD